MLWEQGHDQYGHVCWRHKSTKAIERFNPWLVAGPQPLNPHPNMMHPIIFYPDVNPAPPVESEWKMYRDDQKDGRRYWVNQNTGKPQWENPFKAPKKPSPPPREKKDNIPEHEQWIRKISSTGDKYWYNNQTGATQIAMPKCRRKYT